MPSKPAPRLTQLSWALWGLGVEKYQRSNDSRSSWGTFYVPTSETYVLRGGTGLFENWELFNSINLLVTWSMHPKRRRHV